MVVFLEELLLLWLIRFWLWRSSLLCLSLLGPLHQLLLLLLLSAHLLQLHLLEKLLILNHLLLLLVDCIIDALNVLLCSIDGGVKLVESRIDIILCLFQIHLTQHRPCELEHLRILWKSIHFIFHGFVFSELSIDVLALRNEISEL